MKAAKFVVALVGAVASAVATLVAPDSTAGKVISIVIVAATAVGVYFTPNKAAEPDTE